MTIGRFSSYRLLLAAIFVATLFSSGAEATLRCEPLFAPDLSLESVAAKIVKLQVADRRAYASPLFTEQALSLLKNQRIALSRTIAVTESKRGAVGYARRHLQKLTELVERDVRMHGDATEETLVRIGFHLGRLNAYLLKPGHVRQSELWATADDFKSIDATYNVHAKVLDEGLLFFPTQANISIEELTTSLANDIAPLGVIRKTVKADGTGFAPDFFYTHDLNHAGDYVVTLRQIAKRRDPRSRGDLRHSPSVQLAKTRFKWLTEQLKELPPYERKAGFTALFYLTHEHPGMGLLDILARKRGALKFEMPNGFREIFRVRLTRANDLASDVPRKFLFKTKKDAVRFADVGEKVLSDLLADGRIAN